MNDFVLEVCVDSYESAINAIKGGATRLELCSNIIIGGTTPSIELLKKIKNNFEIPINILIRPRFGDFLYSDFEFDIIKREIKNFKYEGVNGIVFGALTPEGNLDIKKMEQVCSIFKNITLHRAFDVSSNPFKTLQDAIDLNINTILTSGQKDNCTDGKILLKELVKKANKKIDILVCSGISHENIEEIYNFTNAKSFHLSGKVEKKSLMKFRKENVNMGIKGIDEFTILETCEENIRKVKNILDRL